MVINSKTFLLFKNLSQFEFENVYYDFHNDFDCIKVIFDESFLLILFKKIANSDIVSIKLDKAILQKVEFSNSLESLTIDNFYRGRFEKDGELVEHDSNGKSYFYLDFYEGIKLELWCEFVIVEKVEV